MIVHLPDHVPLVQLVRDSPSARSCSTGATGSGRLVVICHLPDLVPLVQLVQAVL